MDTLARVAGGRASDARPLGFLLCSGIGVLANAAVKGAFGGPHDRHGARLAGLLTLAGLLPRRQRGDGGDVGPQATMRAGAAAS